VAVALCFMSILKGNNTYCTCLVIKGRAAKKGAKFHFICAAIGGAFLAIQKQISQAVGGGVSRRVSGCDRGCSGEVVFVRARDHLRRRLDTCYWLGGGYVLDVRSERG